MSLRSDPEILRRLQILQQDNSGVVRRKIAPIIEEKIIPLVNRLMNERKLPPGLAELELEAKKKVMYPRSIYKYQKLYDGCHLYDYVPDKPYLSTTMEVLSTYSHPWRPSSTFHLDLQLDRNKRALDKGAGLPKLGRKKKDELQSALQYVNDYLKPHPLISNMYSVFPGYRTQQSPPDDPKVRLVWMYPITSWLLECEALDDSLTATINANQNPKLDIKTFYLEPMKELPRWMDLHASKVTTWVNGDASSYDTTVRASELAAGWQYFAGNYEFVKLCARYNIYCSLVMPEDDLRRTGGMPSGSKFTNLGDGFTNLLDYYEAFNKLGLTKYLECTLVNGDDITFGFSNLFDEDMMAQVAKISRRKLNVEKTKLKQWVWNSKWYIDEDIITRTVYRVLNSIMFSERRSNPITGSAEMIEIVLAMQLHDIEQHPIGHEVMEAIKVYDKYHISGMTDEELKDAATQYLSDHSWMVEAGMFPDIDHFIQWIRQTEYARL